MGRRGYSVALPSSSGELEIISGVTASSISRLSASSTSTRNKPGTCNCWPGDCAEHQSADAGLRAAAEIAEQNLIAQEIGDQFLAGDVDDVAAVMIDSLAGGGFVHDVARPSVPASDKPGPSPRHRGQRDNRSR